MAASLRMSSSTKLAHSVLGFERHPLFVKRFVDAFDGEFVVSLQRLDEKYCALQRVGEFAHESVASLLENGRVIVNADFEFADAGHFCRERIDRCG